ncbi:MAG TPA: acyl-CoA dehydratase activase [Clostridia bacterium]|nr:acyl-CoA dehydratase activase [Clostridia bacterium]
MDIAVKNTRALGIDIGSTTAKAVLTEGGNVLYQKYERHFSQVRAKTIEMLREIEGTLQEAPFTFAISGSAGLGMAEAAGLPFVQEVYATGEVVKRLEPDASAVIELGGEDAKIIFFTGGMDERMNGSCAGGTGAFIDQMAILLNMTVDEMDEAAQKAKRIYPIASRCGVFAKTDIQPLLNQGASKADVAASIYQAVVNQTVVGLAQGRRISGKVLFMGGPLYYCKGLRARFRETLHLTEETGVCPSYARFAVALGAALYSASDNPVTYAELIDKLTQSAKKPSYDRGRLQPLFQDEKEYEAFQARHAEATVQKMDIASYVGRAWLGIDCGSTTTKLALISEDKKLLYSFYSSNLGSPVALVLEQLKKLRRLCGSRIRISGCAATGYGEELIRYAFHTDAGVVETIAHYTAAKYFRPDVDFILDIGGQDIKCFRILGGAIDSIFLNEACSSGCGSFVETFAKSMGYETAEFARLGLKSKAPVNLGSRCTVFMNSSVKQSQKDGATVEDISAGLSISVVKNAIYKVIRAGSADELGKHIVVQGGTFLNDAVLRAFELELRTEVIRPAAPELMGAFGAALYAMRFAKSALLSQAELDRFEHTSRSAVCKGCTNHCHLTVNMFRGGGRYISGNQCEKALGVENKNKLPNLHQWKRDYLSSYVGQIGKRGKIGLPLALGMYELLPLWYGVFTNLGYEVVSSGLSDGKTYFKGQFSIPSDTACYPAKIMHGHVEELLEAGVGTIFCPCLTYNVDEKAGDNHYNCPIVAYYAELLNGNMESLKSARFFHPYLDIGSRAALARTLYKSLRDLGEAVSRNEVRRAVNAGFKAYEEYMREVRREGEKALRYARENKKRVMILAGRPYHVDPEIGHGIDKLAASLGFVVVSEDSVCHLAPPKKARVLNQWTYHARLYCAARFAAQNEDVELVQLVSFGCGLDAVTTDEVRSILEGAQKFYTQVKIDEITNLGAVRIRLRSLLGALEEKSHEAEIDLYPLYQGDEKGVYDTGPDHAAHAL